MIRKHPRLLLLRWPAPSRKQVPWIVFAFLTPLAMLAIGIVGAQLTGPLSIPWTDFGKSR